MNSFLADIPSMRAANGWRMDGEWMVNGCGAEMNESARKKMELVGLGGADIRTKMDRI